MRTWTTIGAGGLSLLALASSGWWGAFPSGDQAPQPPSTPPSASPEAGPPAADEMPAATTGDVATATATSPDRVLVHSMAALALRSDAEWGQTVSDAEIEAMRLDTAELGDDELASRAQAMFDKGEDPCRAMSLWHVLLERDITPPMRGMALLRLGILQRASDPRAAMATLRVAIAAAGLDSVEGVTAGFQFLWSARQGDAPAAALTMARDMLAGRGLADGLRPIVRWYLAQAAIDQGDVTLARSELQVLRGEVGDGSSGARMVADLERRLGW